jgi:nucleotide-binding universal stress UspA family protein
MGSNNVRIRKILLAMDGSESSFRASRYAIGLAKAVDSEITLLHVLENIRQGGAIALLARYGSVRPARGFLKTSQKAARKWIRKVERDAENNGVKLSTKLVLDQSSKAEEILKQAEKSKADLIILGTRGLTKFKKIVIGSVANTVLGNAKCPVLIVK